MLSWVSVNANDGSVIADLPNLRVDGALKQTLMRYESQTASLPLDGAPSNWRQATRKGATFLVALDEDENPLWGGMVIRKTTTHDGDAKLSLVTPEAYFDRVYVGDETYTATPQNTIVRLLVEKYARTVGISLGLPIRVEVLGGTGAVRDRVYKDSDDKTLYSILTELSGVLGGPEWAVRWEWVGTKLGLVLSVSDRIGSPAPADLNPAAQFYLPGSVTSAELAEGYGSGEGANDVMAVSTGVDNARPQSPHNSDQTDLRPRFEYRWTPSTSITDVGTLAKHAQRALAAMKNGTLALSITANRKEAPQLNQDWRLGDDIGFDLTAPSWPNGITGTARCVGWELTDTTITPLVDVTGIEGID